MVCEGHTSVCVLLNLLTVLKLGRFPLCTNISPEYHDRIGAFILQWVVHAVEIEDIRGN